MAALETLVETVFAEVSLLSLVLSGLRKQGSGSPRKVVVKPILLRGSRVYQFEYQVEKKVLHRNLPSSEAQTEIKQLLTVTFRQGQFYTTDGDFQVLVNKKGEANILKHAASKQAVPLTHNRQKNYLLPEGQPHDFLIRLGVMTETGQVITAKYDKFRQVNRFLEMVEDVISHLPQQRPLSIVDFGSGKSYLTFALYYYLHTVKRLPVKIIGLDLKQDVIAHCAQIAADLGYDDLRFAVGDIQGYQGLAETDMVVSLHACDTATDDALAKAVRWGASVILAVPCCQYELFSQIQNQAMRPMLKHGIIKERFAALLTDSLRAQLLEICGYTVQMLEFIALEHTPKNILIRAVKQPHPKDRTQKLIDYRVMRDFWQVTPSLETSLEELAR